MVATQNQNQFYFQRKNTMLIEQQLNRPLAQLLSAQVIGAEGLGFDSQDSQIGTVSPTARHCCDVSVLPKR